MATRIQEKSRTNLRPIGAANYSTGGATTTYTAGKAPREDPRGYEDVPVGVPFPTLVAVTVVA